MADRRGLPLSSQARLSPPLVKSTLRIAHPCYGHTLAPHHVGEEDWGSKVDVITSLGFKDASPRNVPLRSDRKRVLFLGDSFTEGSYAAQLLMPPYLFDPIARSYPKACFQTVNRIAESRNLLQVEVGTVSAHPGWHLGHRQPAVHRRDNSSAARAPHFGGVFSVRGRA